MSRRGYRQAMANHRVANTSWSIKWAVKQEDGSLKRWRHHFNASLGRPGSSEEHEAKRASARDQAREKARALTQDPNVVWVTVFPPKKSYIFNLRWDHPEAGKRLAPVARWTRSKGWTTHEDE